MEFWLSGPVCRGKGKDKAFLSAYWASGMFKASFPEHMLMGQSVIGGGGEHGSIEAEECCLKLSHKRAMCGFFGSLRCSSWLLLHGSDKWTLL